ncbi:MAG: gliding motility-associated protein GldE [Cytophagales bacterium]|nr:gliding motility-associated protein GldE [Cytophagales bacterium]
MLSFILLQIDSSLITYLVINLSILTVLLLVSALISGSEVAFFSLSTERIKECAGSESTTDKQIYQLLKDPKRLLATILIFNNLINVAIVTLSTFITWHIQGDKTENILTVLAVTFAIVFVGEVIPKVYATQKNLEFARFTTKMLAIANKLFTPLSSILLSISNIIEKRVEKKGYNISIEELNQALEITTQDNTTEEEKEILKGIVNFSTISAKQIMHSRLDIFAIDYKTDFHLLLEKINTGKYSRVPVYKDTVDKITGILYIKDLLPFIDQKENFRWQKLLRAPYFIPESKKIDDLFKSFQEKRVHMAIVIDEYGGTSGLLTLEDIIEEIVGEINDEFDGEDIEHTEVEEGIYIFPAKTPLNDVYKVVETANILEEIKGESESLGGAVLELFERMPKKGESISFKGIELSIEAVDKKRINLVKMKVK